MRVLFILFWGVLLKAQTKLAMKPVCGSETVTRNCKFFKELINEENIMLSDGTYFRNPLWKSDNKSSAPRSVTIAQSGYYGAKLDEQLYKQSQIFDLLENKAATPFKMYLSLNASALFVEDENNIITLPWPPESSKPQRARKKIKDVKQQLENLIGKEKVSELKTLLINDIKIYQEQEAEQRKKAEANTEKLRVEEENNKKIGERKKIVEKLFEEAREDVIKIISRGKSETQLTPEEKLFVNKIKMLKLYGLEEGEKSCDGQNANYNALNLKIRLCEGFTFSSNRELLGIFAHEIVHSVDSCSAEMPVYKIDYKRLEQYLSVSKKLTDDQVDYQTLQYFVKNKVNNFSIDFDLMLGNKDVYADLVNNNIVTKLQDGVSSQKHPLKKERECLVKKLKVIDTNPEDIDITKKQIKRRIESVSNFGDNDKKSLLNYERILEKHPSCFKTATHKSQLGESMGDMFFTLVQEKHLHEFPPKNEVEKISSIANLLKDSCDESYKNQLISPLSTQQVFSDWSDPHPSAEDRLRKIILNLPSQAEIFGCRRVYPSCFDHLSLIKTDGSVKPKRPEGMNQ